MSKKELKVMFWHEEIKLKITIWDKRCNHGGLPTAPLVGAIYHPTLFLVSTSGCLTGDDAFWRSLFPWRHLFDDHQRNPSQRLLSLAQRSRHPPHQLPLPSLRPAPRQRPLCGDRRRPRPQHGGRLQHHLRAVGPLLAPPRPLRHQDGPRLRQDQRRHRCGGRLLLHQ